VHCGLRTVGFSVITDLCFPDTLQPANVDEIIRVAQSAEPKLTALIMGVLAGERGAKT
jgi:purine-nucleoside phosphorylase